MVDMEEDVLCDVQRTPTGSKVNSEYSPHPTPPSFDITEPALNDKKGYILVYSTDRKTAPSRVRNSGERRKGTL